MKGEEKWKKERKEDPLLKKPPKREAISSPAKLEMSSVIIFPPLSLFPRLLDIQTSPSLLLLAN